MRWDTRRVRFDKKMERIAEWHQWFAWHPVTIGNKVYWLERVWRRANEKFLYKITYYYRSPDNP